MKEIKIITGDKGELLDVVGLPDTMVYTHELIKSKYQGWTNYATWRINLEIFSGMDFADWYGEEEEAHPFYEFVDGLKDYVNEFIEDECKNNLYVAGYAYAFVEDVNFNEIAESILSDYPELKNKIVF